MVRFTRYIFGPLTRLAAIAIAQNIDDDNLLNKLLDEELFPAVLVPEVCHAVQKLDLVIRPQHFRLFVRQNITELDLSFCGHLGYFADDEVDEIASNIACDVAAAIIQIGESLTHLNLNKWLFMLSEDVVRVVSNIPNIRQLYLLDGINCSDAALRAIGSRCQQLQELGIGDGRESKVTNHGIELLCLTDSGESRKLPITRLIIQANKVSGYGTFVALNNLPDLESIDFHLFESLVDFAYREWKPIGKTSALKALRSSNYFIQEESITKAAEIFPELRCIDLFYGVPAPSLFHKFVQLQELVLRYAGVDRLELTLQAVGNRLKILSLEDIKGKLRLYRIASLCPNLESLEVHGDFHVSESVNAMIFHEPFRQLRKVKLIAPWSCGTDQWNFPASQLSWLLTTSRELESVTLRCDSLTDELVNQIFDYGSLRCLDELALDRCHNIKIGSVLKFADVCRSLRKIKILNCLRIDGRDVMYAKSYVQENNLRVTICHDSHWVSRRVPFFISLYV